MSLDAMGCATAGNQAGALARIAQMRWLAVDVSSAHYVFLKLFSLSLNDAEAWARETDLAASTIALETVRRLVVLLEQQTMEGVHGDTTP